MKKQYIDHYGKDSLPQIADAVENGAEFFITSNKEVLEDRDEIQKKYPIKIRTSKEWLRERGAR